MSGISVGVGAVFYFWVFTFIGYENNILASFSISALIFLILVYFSKLVTKDDVSLLTRIYKDYIKSFKSTKQ